jgi:hypothetical protein
MTHSVSMMIILKFKMSIIENPSKQRQMTLAQTYKWMNILIRQKSSGKYTWIKNKYWPLLNKIVRKKTSWYTISNIKNSHYLKTMYRNFKNNQIMIFLQKLIKLVLFQQLPIAYKWIMKQQTSKFPSRGKVPLVTRMNKNKSKKICKIYRTKVNI